MSVQRKSLEKRSKGLLSTAGDDVIRRVLNGCEMLDSYNSSLARAEWLSSLCTGQTWSIFIYDLGQLLNSEMHNSKETMPIAKLEWVK